MSEVSLLYSLPELLRGSALLWFRNNRNSWKNWTEFLEDFYIYYMPAAYTLRLEEEIVHRKQKSRRTG